MTLVFRHPKYYKELRKRNKLDQVISSKRRDGACERAPGPGLKQQATSCYYCGGNCPNEPKDSEFLCDSYAGDIDDLYKNK